MTHSLAKIADDDYIQKCEKFRIKQVAPFNSSLKSYTEDEARQLVKSIRERHSCEYCKAIAALKK